VQRGVAATLTEQERIAQQVARLSMPHPSTARGVRTGRMVRREQIAELIALVEQFEVLHRLGTFDVAEARETLQFIGAFRPIADQFDGLLSAVNYTMEARKARVAAAAGARRKRP
jgi:hypothetical protein